MAVTFDVKMQLYVDIRRGNSYYGMTADDAKAIADKAEALRAPRKSTLPVKRVRHSVLGKITGAEK